ncbi:cellulose synthase A catalytic subunit 2 [UDP-forming]-like protein [Tanacetum coccineum]
MQLLAKMVLRLFRIKEEENQRKKTNEKTKKGKKTKEASPQIHALENIEEGIKGKFDSEKTSLMPQIKFERKLVNLPFIASTLLEEGDVPPGATSTSLLKEAIHVISCGYKDKTEWGKELNCWEQLKTTYKYLVLR